MPLIYTRDEYGNEYPVLTGEDAQGNPVLITEDNQQSQSWFGVLNHGIDAANNFLGGRARNNNFSQQYPQGYPTPGAVATVSANSGGVGGGFKLDTTTIILLGALAFFLLKGK